MKFWFFLFYKASIHLAIEKQNTEIVKLLLSCKTIDVNIVSISNSNYLIIFQYEFNYI